jgi:hypothetical protein
MHKKTVLLSVLSASMIALLFAGDFMRSWWQESIVASIQALPLQWQHPSREDRMAMRFGRVYTLLNNIKIQLDKNHSGQSTVLLPPSAYLNEQTGNTGHPITLPEPAVCYYLCGLRTVGHNSSNVAEATFTLIVKNGKMQLLKIENSKQLNFLLETYKNYPAEL